MLSRNNVSETLRYGIVTVIAYAGLLAGTAALVELVKLPESIAYVIALTLAYIGVYIASSTYVFKAHDHKTQTVKYITSVIVFWALNNLLYNIMVHTFDVYYLYAAIFNVAIFGPLRFLIYKFLVFPNMRTNK